MNIGIFPTSAVRRALFPHDGSSPFIRIDQHPSRVMVLFAGDVCRRVMKSEALTS